MQTGDYIHEKFTLIKLHLMQYTNHVDLLHEILQIWDAFNKHSLPLHAHLISHMKEIQRDNISIL